MSQLSQVPGIVYVIVFVIAFVFAFVFVIVILLIPSSLWSNVSKVIRLWGRSLKVFSKCICLCHCLCLCICLRHCFFLSGHVLSSPWSNVSRVTSLWGHSGVVFSKGGSLTHSVSQSVTRSPIELSAGQLKTLIDFFEMAQFSSFPRDCFFCFNISINSSVHCTSYGW